MSSYLPSLISGGVGLLGGFHQANTAKQISQKQMDFQERMSNTAYQRSRADMEAAGINPMLAVSQGGASSPSGSTYQPQNFIGESMNSALSAKRTMAEIENLKAMNRKINAEASLMSLKSFIPELIYELGLTPANTAKAIETYKLPRSRTEEQQKFLDNNRTYQYLLKAGKIKESKK